MNDYNVWSEITEWLKGLVLAAAAAAITVGIVCCGLAVWAVWRAA